MAVKTPSERLLAFNQNPFVGQRLRKEDRGQIQANKLLSRFFEPPNPRQSGSDRAVQRNVDEGTLAMAILLSHLKGQGIDREFPGIPTAAFNQFRTLSGGIDQTLNRARIGLTGQGITGQGGIGGAFNQSREQAISDIITNALGNSFGIESEQRQAAGNFLSPRNVKPPRGALSGFNQGGAQAQGGNVQGSQNQGFLQSNLGTSGSLSNFNINQRKQPQPRRRSGFFAGRNPF